jgi:threonine/homoserine/homoserine lactone efflux protein
MTFELWLLYLAAAVGLSLTPGPNGLLCLSHGATYGFRRTLSTVAGGALGFLVLIAVSLAGLGALLAASERAFAVAKRIGAAYLVHLGIRLWRSPAPAVAQPDRGAAAAGMPPMRMFLQGLLVAVSNPKGLIFFAAFLPQFMVPGTPYGLELAVFGGTFVAVEIAYELAVAKLAHVVAPWLARHGRAFNRATGAAFVGLGAALAASRR